MKNLNKEQLIEIDGGKNVLERFLERLGFSFTIMGHYYQEHYSIDDFCNELYVIILNVKLRYNYLYFSFYELVFQISKLWKQM